MGFVCVRPGIQPVRQELCAWGACGCTGRAVQSRGMVSPQEPCQRGEVSLFY